MQIIESSKYKRDFKKLKKKHLDKEINNINEIIDFISIFSNMKELLSNDLCKIYGIEKKKGNLKEIYTAEVNKKIRMYIRPVGEYPYDLEQIEIVELIEIDDKHYGRDNYGKWNRTFFKEIYWIL